MNYTRTTVFSVFTGRCRELASDSKGAALAITLAFVMPVYLLVIGIYGIGEIVRNKIELQNAADAAAYSASVVQADYLSRIATVNKAMAWTYVDLQKRSLDLAMAVFSEYVFTQFQKDLNNARQRNTPCCMHIPGVHYNCGTDILVLDPVLWLSGTGVSIPELAREFNGQGFLARFLLTQIILTTSLANISSARFPDILTGSKDIHAIPIRGMKNRMTFAYVKRLHGDLPEEAKQFVEYVKAHII